MFHTQAHDSDVVLPWHVGSKKRPAADKGVFADLHAWRRARQRVLDLSGKRQGVKGQRSSGAKLGFCKAVCRTTCLAPYAKAFSCGPRCALSMAHPASLMLRRNAVPLLLQETRRAKSEKRHLGGTAPASVAAPPRRRQHRGACAAAAAWDGSGALGRGKTHFFTDMDPVGTPVSTSSPAAFAPIFPTFPLGTFPSVQ